MSSANRVLAIHKSRTNILEHMEKLNYNINDYNIFSINEVDAMYINSQLDMLISHNTENKKVYIKYYFSVKNSSQQIRPATLDTIIEDLYEIENILTSKDTLVIIIDSEPNKTIMQRVKYLYERNGIFVVIHNIKRLQFNILKHELVPDVEIMTADEVTALSSKLNIMNTTQLPEISRYDPMALAIMLRPNEVIRIKRNSPTALETTYYRVCVH
jgi:DNA-directed RNA polymerase subunit H (RpoH/RPB5)